MEGRFLDQIALIARGADGSSCHSGEYSRPMFMARQRSGEKELEENGIEAESRKRFKIAWHDNSRESLCPWNC